MAEVGQDIKLCVELLSQGKLVGIPTETVYGLAANAFDHNAVVSIFEAKNRPLFDPLIVHTDSLQKVRQFVKDIPEKALVLANAFWPGPLTLLLPRSEVITDIVTSGLDTVAVRIPDHPLTIKLLSELTFPVAAPSANPFGYVSPTSANHVKQQLGPKIPYILDGGPCKVGIESTIIGFEDNSPVVYRLGGLALEELENYVGEIKLDINQSSDPKAPGQLKSHYAPRKPLFIGDVKSLMADHQTKTIGVISFTSAYDADEVEVLSQAGDLHEAARNLFAALRKLDESEVEIIIAEKFPNGFLGRAINDRLKRAAVN